MAMICRQALAPGRSLRPSGRFRNPRWGRSSPSRMRTSPTRRSSGVRRGRGCGSHSQPVPVAPQVRLVPASGDERELLLDRAAS